MPTISRLVALKPLPVDDSQTASPKLYNTMLADIQALPSDGSITNILNIVHVIDKYKKTQALTISHLNVSSANIIDAEIDLVAMDLWKAIGIKPPLTHMQIDKIGNYNNELKKIETDKIANRDLAAKLREYREAPFPRDKELSKSLSNNKILFSIIQVEGKERYDVMMRQLKERYKKDGLAIETSMIREELAAYQNSSLPEKLIALESAVKAAQLRADLALDTKAGKQAIIKLDSEQIGMETFGFSVTQVKTAITEEFVRVLDRELDKANSKNEVRAIKEHFEKQAEKLGIGCVELTKSIAQKASNKVGKRKFKQFIIDLITPTNKQNKINALQLDAVATFDELSKDNQPIQRVAVNSKPLGSIEAPKRELSFVEAVGEQRTHSPNQFINPSLRSLK